VRNKGVAHRIEIGGKPVNAWIAASAPTRRIPVPTHKSFACALAAGAVLTGFAVGPVHAAQKFQTPSGRITYKLTSPMMNGTNTLMWSNFGKSFRQYTVAKVNAQGKSMDITSWVISDGESIYMHTPMQGQSATRMKLTQDILKKMDSNMSMMQAPKNLGKVLGKANIAGKDCEIREMPQGVTGKMWVWQNLPLKMEITGKNGVGMTMEATKVETPVTLAPTIFKVPAGMKIQEAPLPNMKPGAMKPGAKKP
jgi:hypothetical protein